jgi:hypothetical protein
MTDFDLLHAHATQDITLFRRACCGDYTTCYAVPGQNIAFWVHPYAEHPAHAKDRHSVKVWLRVPSKTFFGKLFKKFKWSEIALGVIEQEYLHPPVWAIKQHVDATDELARVEARSNLVKGVLGMKDEDYTSLKKKVEGE